MVKSGFHTHIQSWNILAQLSPPCESEDWKSPLSVSGQLVHKLRALIWGGGVGGEFFFWGGGGYRAEEHESLRGM